MLLVGCGQIGPSSPGIFGAVDGIVLIVGTPPDPVTPDVTPPLLFPNPVAFD